MSDSGDDGLLTTLPRTPHQTAAGPAANLDSLKGDVRFEQGALIAKGGMGEVFSCTDVKLKRPMAMKHATSRSAVDLERFVREARVQGQLEHPGIVPVHELGLSDDGVPYFTMKRVRGVTLSEVLEALRQKNPEALKKHTRRRLLAAFQQVCQAVEFAHSQGVLHRDLKPANVMLGDFGEVYVLDWGLAKHVAQDEAAQPMPVLVDSAVGATPTVAGSIMGTPGYMSPELVVGQPASVQSDVFALGSMLFELLSLERMIPGDSVMSILVATRDGFEPSLRVRAPRAELPPELDALVKKACAREAKDRFPSVRALEEAIERFLAGERDHELRSELAKAHAAKAATELAQAGDTVSDEARRRALAEVGRSLALDPNAGAFTTLLQLLQTPPKETPDEVRASMADSRVKANRAALLLSGIGLLLLFLYLPVFLVMGSKNWAALGALFGLMAFSALGSYELSRLSHPRPPMLLFSVAGFMAFGAIINIWWVPLIVATPTVTVAAMVYVSLLPKTFRVVTITLAVLALTAPYLLWALGVTGPPVQLAEGKILLASGLLDFHDGWTHALIIDAMVTTLLTGAGASYFLRRTLDRAQERIATQAWNLRQLLPPEAGDVRLLDDTAADPKCALKDFFEGKETPAPIRSPA